jgi:FecR protein
MIRSKITPMKTPIRNSNVLAAIILIAAAFAIARLVFAADHKQARVTEVIRDVHVLTPQRAAHPAVVNETVHEGNAVRTGTDSRSELQFADQTITRLGANTVFSFGVAARTYDLGSGAILMTAPKNAGTVKVSSGVATCAISGFTAIWEAHNKFWNKVLVIEGDGDVWLNKNPDDPRHMHSRQILVFPPNAKVLPQPQEFDVCKVINNGLLITGFTNQLPSWPLCLAQCDLQRSAPAITQLVDPTHQDIVDQSISARPSPGKMAPTPIPTIIPSDTRLRRP